MKYFQQLSSVFYLICLFFISNFQISAQFNTTLLSNIDYEQTVNDVWGYVADGHEYALLGTRTGTAIIDVTDPATPNELFFVPGPSSLWRDMKVWGHYAYVTNETDSGLHIFDLQYLPDSIIVTNWMGGVFQGATLNLESAHNIFIDENGIGYVLGSNIGVGGALMIDLNSDPLNPPIVGLYNEEYCHDVFVRGDTLWTAEIYEGQFAVVDITDKAMPVIMATHPTPFAFTHNCWLSEDGNTFITTDEKSNAPIGIFDVSDISDIKELAEYRSNPGSGVIPHNTFFYNNFIVTSYYRDGARITDATFPNAPIEVGYYDTSPLAGDNFNGCWGVYPYLPSGILLASDMEEGLFVIQPEYTQACYLQGTITNAQTGLPLLGVQIVFNGMPETQTQTGLNGTFQTGVANNGVYSVTLSLYGYETQVIEVEMQNGIITPLSIAMEPIPSYNVTIQVVNSVTGEPISNAEVLFMNQFVNETAFTDASGQAVFLAYEPGTHEIYIGKWGYRTLKLTPFVSLTNNTFTIHLTPGYYDDFFFDYGWTVSGDVTSGAWEMVKPIGTEFAGQPSNVGADVTSDFGEICFVTGNGGTGIVNNVNNGTTNLRSPVFDLSGYTNPQLRYHRYLSLQNGSNDTLFIQISNGIETKTIEAVKDGDPFEYNFHETVINIADHLQPTANMQLLVSISDMPTSGHVVEAAFDKFEIVEAIPPTADFVVANSVASCSSLEVQFVSTSTSGAALNWSFPGGVPSESTSSTPTVTYDSPGEYNVTLAVTNEFGTVTVTVNNYVMVYPSPNVQIIIPATTCQSTDFELIGDPDTLIDSYVWQGNGVVNATDVIATVNVELPGPQTYSVTVTDTNGCTNTESVTVDIGSMPLFTASASNDTVCVGGSINLQAFEGEYNYWWTGGNNMFTPLLPNFGFVNTTAPATAGSLPYTVTGTDPTNGCTASADIWVAVIDPITSIVAPTSACSGEEIMLSILGDSAGSNNFVWTQNGMNLPGNTSAITAAFTEDATIAVQITTAGCTDMAEVNLSILPVPEAEAIATGLFIDTYLEGEACWGVPFELQCNIPLGTGPVTVLWEGPGVENPDELITFATVEGEGEDTLIYQLTVTDEIGCQNIIVIPVVMNPGSSCILGVNQPVSNPIVTVSPNPSENGIFVIQAEHLLPFGEVRIEVFNSIGQLIWLREIEHNYTKLQQEIQLSEYSPGIYLVRLRTAGNQFSNKIIIR